MSRLLRCAIGATLVTAIGTRSAKAAETTTAQTQTAARAAYDEAVEAHKRGNYSLAAREFARADRLVANDSALEDAILETLRADDGVLGLTLVARAARSPDNAALQRAAAAAREKFRGRAGRFEVDCLDGCAVEVDGHAVDPEVEQWLAVGTHVVVLSSPSYRAHRDEHQITVLPLETTRVRFVPPPVTSPPATATAPARSRGSAGGLSPVWFWAGAGVTVALAGVTTLSGLDVSGRRDDFEGLRCPEVGSDVCDRHARDGDAAVTRTNVLLGATVLAAAATATTFFLVRWTPSLTTSVGAASGGGMRASLTGHF